MQTLYERNEACTSVDPILFHQTFRLYPLLRTSFDIASATEAYPALIEADDSIVIMGGLLCEY